MDLSPQYLQIFPIIFSPVQCLTKIAFIIFITHKSRPTCWYFLRTSVYAMTSMFVSSSTPTYYSLMNFKLQHRSMHHPICLCDKIAKMILYFWLIHGFSKCKIQLKLINNLAVPSMKANWACWESTASKTENMTGLNLTRLHFK